jgi:nucleoside-diphosphate-sugar epimerase
MIPPLYTSNVSDNVSDRHVVANIANAIYSAAKNKSNTVTLNGCETNQRQLVHVDDFSSAALLAQTVDAPLLNVAYPETIIMRELAESICEHYNYSGEVSWTNSKPLGNGAATNPGPQDLDIALANSFGWQPVINMQKGVQSFNVL